MSNKNSIGFVVATCAAVLLSTASFGQETGTADETSNELDGQLSLGEDVTNEPQIGQPYLQETVGDFELRCIKTEDGNDPCQLYQLLKDDKGQPIVEFSAFRLPEGGQATMGATIVAPLETALQQQLTIAVDNGNPRRYPFAFCNQVGCYSRIGLTAEDVTAFKRGSAATLTIVPIISPDAKVTVNLSLTGFTAGIGKTSFPQN